MILTVTLNAALDVTCEVAALVPGASHRVGRSHERAGGKGLNVSRVLHALGRPSTVTGLAGGSTGQLIRAELESAGLAEQLLDIGGESRRTVAIVSAEDGDATIFNQSGPTVSPAEWDAFTVRFRSLVADCRVAVLSGSLPPGVPRDAYALLTRLAHRYGDDGRGAAAVVDTSGPALRAALSARPDLVKPNAAELAGLAELLDDCPELAPTPAQDGSTASRSAPPSPGTGTETGTGTGHTTGAGPTSSSDGRPGEVPDRPGDGPHDVGGRTLPEAVARLRALGARAVVASAGPDGLYADTPHGAWYAVPPTRLAGNPTGAGDACVAALAAGIADGRTACPEGWPEVLREAVAVSAAAVLRPVAGEFDARAHEELRARVTVRPAPVHPVRPVRGVRPGHLGAPPATTAPSAAAGPPRTARSDVPNAPASEGS
ncbi:1-phosphofructokinase family hexose kinase [Streptomyces sp. XM4193]|uniref:1-phosphofructokinase family hexose kinase n=1 Tax=Streptomyces sp. XM4193 TaxID=2929782 RepID=UPI001FF9F5BA|nr:1-phosphofructokinase family hexose kinase [Streptomyces sp. XM4193]MCK1795365.1 1-phosphofructokinase family hexose kinase [Streptomyces sp. XM4193]